MSKADRQNRRRIMTENEAPKTAPAPEKRLPRCPSVSPVLKILPFVNIFVSNILRDSSLPKIQQALNYQYFAGIQSENNVWHCKYNHNVFNILPAKY
jgi:hypothetical protein